MIVAIVAAAIVAIGVVVGGILLLQRNSKPTSAPQAAETQLYSALGNAAKQQTLRVGMYRETFANKADADTRQNIGKIDSSVAEVDIAASKYRSVFATNLLNDDNGFSVGRCIDGTTYNDYYQSPATKIQRASTLQDAATRLTLIPEGNLSKVTEALQFISCPHLGLLPGNVVITRLSDGVFPVTLSSSQADSWVKKITETGLFTVKDEGVVERNGQKLRKLSFVPKKDELTICKQLYDIFYETAEIAKIKAEQPKAETAYEFQSINPLNSGGVGGFYLVDEAKNLPVYSELYGINPDKKLGETRTAEHNIARTKQTYAFPMQLSINLTTPLEFLE